MLEWHLRYGASLDPHRCAGCGDKLEARSHREPAQLFGCRLGMAASTSDSGDGLPQPMPRRRQHRVGGRVSEDAWEQAKLGQGHGSLAKIANIQRQRQAPVCQTLSRGRIGLDNKGSSGLARKPLISSDFKRF